MNGTSKMKEIADKMKELLDEAKQVVENEAQMRAKWAKKLAVQLKTGEIVAFCDDWTEVEAAMKAHAQAQYAKVVAECRAKHVKIVAAEVPETDYVVQEVWHRVASTVPDAAPSSDDEGQD